MGAPIDDLPDEELIRRRKVIELTRGKRMLDQIWRDPVRRANFIRSARELVRRDDERRKREDDARLRGEGE